MSVEQKGNWAIFYCKTANRKEWFTMKLYRKDGVLVSAKTYDEVYKFNRFKEAYNFIKELITIDNPVYDAQVKRVCRTRGKGFYLSGN
jgi:hypothetical protein